MAPAWLAGLGEADLEVSFAGAPELADQPRASILLAMNIRQPLPSAFTTAEFERLLQAGGFGDTRVELRRGMIVKANPQRMPHATVKWALTKSIEAALARAGLRWRAYNEVSVDFAEGFEPLPDIVVWEPAAVPSALKGSMPANAVRLIVEVSDTTLADDIGEKLEDYATAGLAEYWIADVNGRRILRHAGPGGGTYARREPAGFGEAVASLVYPSIVIDTAELASLS